METMIQYITQGETAFTPAVMVGMLMFSLVLECIGSVAMAIFHERR